MKISIWDLDFYKNKRGFNPECMKISSYHKQMGDEVTFITNEIEARRPYDYIYLAKENDKIKNPPVKYFDRRTRLLGFAFRFLGTYALPDIVLACRPDYLLYPERKTQYERAEMIQFFNSKHLPLKLIQDYHNTFKNKKILVVDKDFWKASKKDIVWAFDILLELKSISFLNEIWLKKILYDTSVKEKFLQLSFTKNSDFTFKNDIGDSYEDAIFICDFLKELHKSNPTTDLGYVNFAAITSTHFNSPEDAWNDLERCLKIIKLGKEFGFNFRIQSPPNRVISPYVSLFETLNQWTTIAPKLSLLEFVALREAKKFNCTIEEIYADATKWNDYKMVEMIETLKRKNWLLEYGLNRWKDDILEITKIDWENIKENI